MMTTHRIDRVHGVSDVLPDEYRALREIQTQIEATYARSGYISIAVPILEYTDLFLRKSGEAIITRLYDFQYRNRRLCLRPELTASAIRAYLDHLQAEPLPVRLAYAGPVFRYETPQSGQPRQFTQSGVELIGANGAMADAEIIHLAAHGLDTVGITNYRLIIGHVGPLLHFLHRLDLNKRLRSFLLLHMETLRTAGVERLTELITEIDPSFNSGTPQPSAEIAATDSQLLALAHSTISTSGGTRDQAEIIAGFLTKISRRDQTAALHRALEFMSALCELSGDPQTVLTEAAQLLTHFDSEPAPLNELSQLIDLLAAYGLDSSRITLDLGLTRGLQYYTGTVFELHHDDLGPADPLCGGGRYDELVGVLGGPANIAATGSAYHLERLRRARALEQQPTAAPDLDAIIIPATEADFRRAIQIAEGLRAANLHIELSLTAQALPDAPTSAAARNIPVAVIVDADAAAVGVHQLPTGSETQMPAAQLADYIRQHKIR
ncbi:MAG: ATP phosphoribosyltransferase regulatory subunit [Chloroflexi bacterium]|nr:ATP phosphoribosyltransferase regulatory subunit [Chloroflexota bacterium]